MTIAPGAPILADDLVQSTVLGTSYDSTGGTITTSEAVKGTCTITIPASWNTYDLSAIATFRMLEGGGTLTAIRTITHQLRKTNASGTSGGVNASVIDPAAPDNHVNAAAGGRWLGETATGSVTVVLTMVLSGDSGQASWDDIFMQVVAVRVS